MKNTYCCQCGRPRLRHEAQMPSYHAEPDGCVSTEGKVERHPAPLNEKHPQLIASAGVWRNGGTDRERTHICHRCVAVALRVLLEIIQRDLADFEGRR